MKRKKLAIAVVVAAIVISVIWALKKGDLSSIENIEELGKVLGFVTLIPTLLTVILAFITNNVVFSLLMGFLSGVILLTVTGCNSFSGIPSELVSQTYTSFVNVLGDTENLEIMLLCFVVGGMIEVVRYSGGFESLAVKLSERVSTPRKAGLITSMLGCMIFFDDYANALIVGPVMKPIMDRLHVSREKLSYIVDSTAAPVTGIAIVSSWVAVEISSIEKGLEIAGMTGNGFPMFISSIPFTFYCLFCLGFIFLNSLVGRDFGPMLKAERRARKEGNKNTDSSEKLIVKDRMTQRIISGVGSIAFMVILSIILFYITGKKTAVALGLLPANAPFTFETVVTAISNANTVRLIITSTILASIIAVVSGVALKLFNLKEALKSWFDGAKNLFSTIVMLTLAWCLADTIGRLGTTFFAIEIISGNIPYIYVPLLIFVCCCIVSFASGSYGCLFVVMPLTIPLAYRMIEVGAITNSEIYLSICIASVMAGSIFGDHCSPVTDCTILSAMGSGCETMDHVKTQLPYAMVVAVVSCLAILMVSFGLSVALALIIGLAIEVTVLYVFGRKPI